MKKIEQKDLFELKNVAQPVVAGGDIFFTETKMNEKKNTYETAVYKYTNEGKVAYGDDGTFKYHRMESGLVLSVMKEKIKLLN